MNRFPLERLYLNNFSARPSCNFQKSQCVILFDQVAKDANDSKSIVYIRKVTSSGRAEIQNGCICRVLNRVLF